MLSTIKNQLTFFQVSLKDLNPFGYKLEIPNLRSGLSLICCLAFITFIHCSVFKVQSFRLPLEPDLKIQLLGFSDPTLSLELVGPSGLEPPTLRLSVVRSSQLSYGPVRYSFGGDSRDRTGDLLLARQALSQLSYIPIISAPRRRMPSKLNNEERKPSTADQDVTDKTVVFLRSP